MTSADRSSVLYQRALGAFLSDAGENALTEAYEVGRKMLRDGVGLLDLAELHHRALQGWLERDAAIDASVALGGAAVFFAEILSSFDMHFRRIDKSNAAWKRVNDLLEEEVRRISLALHSEAGNILAQATLEMDLAASSLPRESHSLLASVRRLLNETGERLRHLSHELRPSVLDDLGLVPALTFLAEGVERRTGMHVRVQGEMDRRVTPQVELAVYRVAQEAINNALRHGGESPDIAIRVEIQENCLRCVITDDGKGFDVADVLESNARASLGLLGMRERAAVLEGECTIVSRPGGGTTVDLNVPLQSRRVG